MKKNILVIGNTDGIGALCTEELLKAGYSVIGLSRSSAKIVHPNYSHVQEDVASPSYRETLKRTLASLTHIDLCIFCAGIGEQLNLNDLQKETKVFEVNLMGGVITTELILSKMQEQKAGHFIGLSSMGDMLISPESPSYTASKIGLSRYWEGLGLALKSQNSSVKISNIRFGFVDTKMAKAPIKPFELTKEEAVRFIFDVIEKPRIRASHPKRMLPLVALVSLIPKIKVLFQ